MDFNLDTTYDYNNDFVVFSIGSLKLNFSVVFIIPKLSVCSSSVKLFCCFYHSEVKCMLFFSFS